MMLRYLGSEASGTKSRIGSRHRETLYSVKHVEKVERVERKGTTDVIKDSRQSGPRSLRVQLALIVLIFGPSCPFLLISLLLRLTRFVSVVTNRCVLYCGITFLTLCTLRECLLVLVRRWE